MQQLFNRAVLGVLAQGGPSRHPAYACAYRSSTGRKCAVGQLIADEHYKPALEGRPAFSPMVMDAVRRSNPNLPERAHKLLASLQRAHDALNDRTDEEFLTAFRKRAEAVAFTYHLEMPDAAAV